MPSPIFSIIKQTGAIVKLRKDFLRRFERRHEIKNDGA